MTNSLKQTQVAIATKNPNTQKSPIVEALYGVLGNKSGGGFNDSSFAISNTTWSSSALMRLLRSTNLCQSVFTVKSPHTILAPRQLPGWSRSRTSGADRGNRQTDQKIVWLGVITGLQESGSIPIRSFTAPRSRCLQPRYFSVVCTDTCPNRN
jgi:hypothetical protein